MATYLITGGCGFIGSHLADAMIAEGHHIRILDDLSTGKLSNKPRSADFRHGNVANQRVVEEMMEGTDGCFHLAAVASVERSNLDWVGTHRTNLTGTISVFDTARRVGKPRPIPVVYASSAAIYGDNPELPLSERALPRPLSAYGADKLGCEQHAVVAGYTHNVPTCGLRFFNVYGPRQEPTSPYSGVISIFCDRMKTGRQITIFGDGRQTRDFIYVGDVVRALGAAMQNASADAGVYNICTGTATTVHALAWTIADILEVSPNIFFGPARSGDIRVSLGNPAAARDRLKFTARTTLKEGLSVILQIDGGPAGIH
jgi:UDP-glucose 4-epimerase